VGKVPSKTADKGLAARVWDQTSAHLFHYVALRRWRKALYVVMSNPTECTSRPQS